MMKLVYRIGEFIAFMVGIVMLNTGNPEAAICWFLVSIYWLIKRLAEPALELEFFKDDEATRTAQA